MTRDPQITAFLDQEDAYLGDLIRNHRWAVQYVGEGDEPGEPGFGYTVGLFGLGHPELIMVGLSPDGTHTHLNVIAAMVADGRSLVPGELLTWDDRDGRMLVEQCPNPGEIFFLANRWYRRPPESSVPAYQLTWHHRDGTFPWDPGYPCGPDCQPRPGTWHA